MPENHGVESVTPGTEHVEEGVREAGAEAALGLFGRAAPVL